MEEIINNYKIEHPKAQSPEDFFQTFGMFEVLEMIEATERNGRALVFVKEDENELDGGSLIYA